MTRLKIDDVAKETGLTKRTIRYYEEIGLLEPPTRSEGGVRLYTQENVDRLKKVLLAREVLGFSLQELQHFLAIDTLLASYREGSDGYAVELKKQEELKRVADGLAEQVDMLDLKIHKMEAFRKDMEELLSKVREAIGQPQTAASSGKTSSSGQ
ncbi:MerR family transcriptional regulator [Paenibacillus sp. RC84]|uniref:MerR family transcriptional regulator n=1 Tax=Paenibacillus sp. RC84 TaxID=3156252 RepID=UPI003519BF72